MIVCKEDTLFHQQFSRACTPMLQFVLMIFCTFLTSPVPPAIAAERNPLVLTGPVDTQALCAHFEYTTDDAWEITIGDFAGSSSIDMKPLPGPVPDFGYTAARIWLRVPVVNQTKDVSSWRFYVHANFTQKISIWKISADNQIITLLNLDEDTPFSARPIQHPQLVAPFALEPGEAATIVMAYYSQGASRLTMSIETPESYAALMSVAQAKSYAFYGMMLVMITLALAALVTLRQSVFAAYVGYLCSVLIYVAHADGVAFQYLWPNFPRFNSMASVVAGSGVMVFGALFAITFLQTARYHPVMHRVLQAVIAIIIGLDVLLWIADPQLLKRILVYMITGSVLVFLAAALNASRTRFRETRFYVATWFALLIPAGLFTARYAFGLESQTFPVYDAVRIALVCDALLMGLAIFDRYNQHRQAAMQETLSQSERNLALAQRLAVLEQSYQQVEATAREREEGVKDTVHDLRQPMHALRLSLRQMFSGQSDKSTDFGQIESALGYMEQLVDKRLAEQPKWENTVDVPSAADAGKTVDEPGLYAVLRGVTDMFSSEAREKGLQLRLILSAPDAKVDAYALMRLLSNLVSNAIKYTRQGRVVVGLRRHKDSYRVEVHDTGPGLSGDAFEQALQRNKRLERDIDAADGSGLGLTVVKEIADTQKWRLSSCADRRSGASIRVEL
ncbi:MULTISPECIES: sensor histidine kinase [Mesorhizobium]|nr:MULTISPECIES: sensor histidine kinase [Mesorhizobium]